MLRGLCGASIALLAGACAPVGNSEAHPAETQTSASQPATRRAGAAGAEATAASDATKTPIPAAGAEPHRVLATSSAVVLKAPVPVGTAAELPDLPTKKSVHNLDLAQLELPLGWASNRLDVKHGRYTLAAPASLDPARCEQGPRLEGRLYWQSGDAPKAAPRTLSFDELWPPDLQVTAFEPSATDAANRAPRQRFRLYPHATTAPERVEVRVTLSYGHDDDLHEVTLVALLPDDPQASGPLPVVWRGVGAASNEHLGVCESGFEAFWAPDAKGRTGMLRKGVAEVIDSAEEENSQTPALSVARRTCRPPANTWVAVP